MQKNNDPESGFFGPRIFLALVLCLTGVSLSLLSLRAASPAATAPVSTSAANAPSASTSAPETTLNIATTPGMPRYYTYAPPPGMGETAGEPSIGFNPVSGKVMYISTLQTLQATLPERITPLGSVPESCDADWLDVSFTTTKVRSVDSILFTDQGTGRTFVSQLNTVTQTNPVLIGLNSLMAYSDDDGATWTPAQVNPPDGSNDHETVGAGPYPAALSALANSLNKGHAVYYCGQLGTVNAGSTAFCSRSDDGGLNFGKSIPVYQDTVSACAAAIHGHVKVAPDGTVYLPNQACSGGQAVFVSTDAATTWTKHVIPGSRSMSPAIAPATFDSSDPSVAVATDGTVYFSWTGLVPGGNSTDNHIFVSVSHDQGANWTAPVDVGASIGINNAVFAEAVAGDPDRAAVAFLGTTQTGDHQGASFTGTWYGFVAHTYDGGAHWITVNASGGPVQRSACIWNSGGNATCRNLLDFNDATMDDKGEVLFAYADGCINECETGGPNSYTSKATVARQSGGKGLLAQFDPTEPALPQKACLSACRDDRATYLTWTAPDNGGSDIISYNIYRSDPGHAETLIGTQTDPADNTFNDRSADPTVASYTYRITAVNGLGEGPSSNTVSVPVPLSICLATGGACIAPGITEIVDAAGDETDTLPAHDITSVAMSEPKTDNVTGAAANLVFTMKVASLKDAAGNFTVPAGFRWSIRFNVTKNGVLLPAPPSGIPGDSSASDYYVAMASNGTGLPTGSGNPSFEWGVTSTPNNAARVFTMKGTLDPSSNATADGTITLVVPKSIIQNPGPGDSISLTLASVRGDLPSGTNDTIFDQTGGGAYVLRANNLCLPNTAPLAALTGTPDNGAAPLTVNFDASSSSDVDTIDTIASYTFNFGDGGDDMTQATPTVSHTFNDPGEYLVRLVVTDSRGKQSSNTATFLVEVNGSFTGVVSRKVHGTLTADLPLSLIAPYTVEPRMGGTPSGDHTIVFQFGHSLNSVGSITASAATISGTQNVGASGNIGSNNPQEYVVNLTNVPNASHVSVTLNNVSDATSNLGNISAHMDVLMADVNGNGVLTNADVSLVKGQVAAGGNVDLSNFKDDVNVNGVITNADVSLVKTEVAAGAQLPP